MKEYSPFEPGKPVSPGMFVGRESQITEVDRYLRQVQYGKPQSLFLIGDCGVGKTSLAGFISRLAESNRHLLSVHTFLSGVHSLEGIIQQVFTELAKKARSENLYDKVSSLFGDRIEEVGLFGVNVKFKPNQDQLSALVSDFPEAIAAFHEKIKHHKSGILIILDDINGAISSGEFANWFKSMWDRVNVSSAGFPVFFLLIGLPEKRDLLFKQPPSLMRIFQILEIGRLTDEEIIQFYQNRFEEAGMELEEAAMRLMVGFCSGLPIMMPEIGDAVFWQTNSGIITERDAQNGILDASERIGKKYLDPKFYNVVRSERYRSIIGKIGQHLAFDFTKREIESGLTEEEKRVFGNLLRKLRELGILTQPPELPRGSYRFTNRLYLTYLYMKSHN
ncbi:MAG: ATP-binding protein [Bacteroidota bacterium]